MIPLLVIFRSSAYLLCIGVHSQCREPEYKLPSFEKPLSTQVAVTAFYQTPDAATRFATTFFNQTIDIVETRKMIDFELISLYATILALLAGVGAPMRERCAVLLTCHMLVYMQLTVRPLKPERFARVYMWCTAVAPLRCAAGPRPNDAPGVDGERRAKHALLIHAFYVLRACRSHLHGVAGVGK